MGAETIRFRTHSPKPSTKPRACNRLITTIGFNCPDVPTAIWMMRALVVSNVLARREDTALFVPVHPNSEAVSNTVVQIHCLALQSITERAP